MMRRGRLMQEMGCGAMMAVGGEERERTAMVVDEYGWPR